MQSFIQKWTMYRWSDLTCMDFRSFLGQLQQSASFTKLMGIRQAR